MRKFKLIKDLPTFNAGDIFTLGDDGCLYLTEPCDFNNHWKARVMAYHKNTLERFPHILEDWFEEIEQDKAETITSKTKSLSEICNCLNELASDLADYRLEELSDDLTKIVWRVQDLVGFEARLKEGNETINY